MSNHLKYILPFFNETSFVPVSLKKIFSCKLPVDCIFVNLVPVKNTIVVVYLFPVLYSLFNVVGYCWAH